MAPSLVYHGLIRALLYLALNIMSVQLTLAAGKNQLTPGKSGRYLIYFFALCFFIKHYHYFWCWEFINFFCLFVLVSFAFFVFVLFYFYFSCFLFLFLFCSVVVVGIFVCFLLFLSFWFELFSLKTSCISLLFLSPYSSYEL